MARLLSTWFNGFVGSARSTGNKVLNAFGKVVCEMQEYFASDFMGHGWKIFNSGSEESPEYTLEIDNVKVRKAFIAHELIIDQVRAICGSLGISQACGKVKEVSLRTDEHGNQYYLIKLEGEATHGYGGFVKNDLIRCQRVEVGSDGVTKGIKGYWVKIESANMKEGWFTVMASEFSGEIKQEEESEFVESNDVPMNLPAAGDEIVQYGNTTVTSRQSAIYLHATESGVPTIDLLNGINSKSFSGKIVASLGRIPDGGRFGLYLKNGTIISLNSKSGNYNYHFSENGSFSLGQDAIDYDPATGVVTIGSDVVIKWGANSKSNVTYQIGSSGVNAPTGTWLNSVPPSEVGKYLWTRTKWPDGTYSYSVSYMARDGTPGKDGADGENMRPNLLDYTEFRQETFDNVPNPDKTFALKGTRTEGLNGHGAVQVETAFKINGDLPTPDSYVDFFQQNVKSKIAPSTWYTLSFYLKSKSLAQPLYTYMWTYNTNGLTMVDTTEKMIVDGKEQDTPKDGAVKFPPIHEWTYHTVTFKTAANLPDTCLCLFRAITKQIPQSNFIVPALFLSEPKLELGKAASAWTRSDNDIADIAADKINMPSWVRQWDGQTTELGADYVAAKNAAFGTKDSEGKFSGIAMSGGGFDIGGQNVIGLYAISKDKCAVKINPTTGEYIFVGKILCEEGQMNGLLNGSYIKGITQITNEAEWDDILPVYKETYYKPDFYKLNPIVILSYAKVDAPMIYLPPYDKTAEKLLEAYQFIGYTFWIVNKSGKTISIEPVSSIKIENNTVVTNASGESVLTKSYSNANLQQRKIANGKSASLTGVMDSDGKFFWVIEKIGVNEAITGSTGTITPSFGLGGNTLKWNTGLTGGNSGLLKP